MGSVAKCIHGTTPHAVVPNTTLATDALQGTGGQRGVEVGGQGERERGQLTYLVGSFGCEFKSGSYT